MIMQLSNVGSHLKRISDWIDEKFFPVPASMLERMQQQQRDIEQTANHLKEAIVRCQTLKRSYELEELIRDFKHVWGPRPQVIASHDSLLLQLRNKQSEILNNM